MEAEQIANICTITAEARQAMKDALGAERVVGYRPCLARAFGGVNCALLLSQFWFWTQTPTVQGRGGEGWFWKPQREITEETGLSRRETETARRKLRDLGILQEERRGLPATLHFRLDQDALARLLIQRLPLTPHPSLPAPAPFTRNSRTGLRERAQPVCPHPPIQFAPIRQSITETTPENTLKTTQTPYRPLLPAALKKSLEKRLQLPERQCAVNRQGTARFWDALEAARQKAAQSSEAAARDGPAGE